MAKKTRTTFKKRQKEMARQQRQRDKTARRLEKKETVAPTPPTIDGEDPAIAGIRPGPQPLPDEWNYAPRRPTGGGGTSGGTSGETSGQTSGETSGGTSGGTPEAES